jgi:hypothetical protein
MGAARQVHGHKNLQGFWNKKLFGNQWESEAPAELFTPRFGRSLTLPSNLKRERDGFPYLQPGE